MATDGKAMSEGMPWDVQISFWQGFSDKFYDYTGTFSDKLYDYTGTFSDKFYDYYTGTFSDKFYDYTGTFSDKLYDYTGTFSDKFCDYTGTFSDKFYNNTGTFSDKFYDYSGVFSDKFYLTTYYPSVQTGTMITYMVDFSDTVDDYVYRCVLEQVSWLRTRLHSRAGFMVTHPVAFFHKFCDCTQIFFLFCTCV